MTICKYVLIKDLNKKIYNKYNNKIHICIMYIYNIYIYVALYSCIMDWEWQMSDFMTLDIINAYKIKIIFDNFIILL